MSHSRRAAGGTSRRSRATPWLRPASPGARRATRGCEQIIEATAASRAKPAAATLERIQRTRWELSQVMAALRDADPGARASALNSRDGDDRFVLFPDDPAPPAPKPGSRNLN